MTRDAEEENSVENVKVDPPECEESIRTGFNSYHGDRMSPDNFSMADLDTDSLTIFAQAAEIMDAGGTELQLDSETCSSYRAEMAGYGQDVTEEEYPFEGDADKGSAIVSHSVLDDGTKATIYSVIAEKGEAFVNIVVKDDSEESIQAANETLDQVLARL